MYYNVIIFFTHIIFIPTIVIEFTIKITTLLSNLCIVICDYNHNNVIGYSI